MVMDKIIPLFRISLLFLQQGLDACPFSGDAIDHIIRATFEVD